MFFHHPFDMKSFYPLSRIQHIFRTNRYRNSTSCCQFTGKAGCLRLSDFRTYGYGIAILTDYNSIKDIGFANKSGNKPCLWMFINIKCCIHLFQNTLIDNRNAVTHRKCLFLIMRYINKGNTKLSLQTL